MTTEKSEVDLKATDLRIGNIMCAEDENLHMTTECVITSLTENICTWRSIHPSTKGYKQVDNIVDMKGIELDEEWLRKFSFYQMPHYTVTNSWLFGIGRNRTLTIGCVGTPNLMIILQEEDEKEKSFEQIVLHNWDYDGEMFVHRLQNLIFALTGQDLTAKEVAID